MSQRSPTTPSRIRIFRLGRDSTCDVDERLASDAVTASSYALLDDPFSGEGQRAGFAVAPTTSTSGTERKHGAPSDLLPASEEQLPATDVHAARDTERPKRMNDRSSDGLSDALEEADFYAARGLFDDARAVLRDQLQRSPDLALLRERIAELDMQQAATQASGTRALPRADGDDRAFDIAASLDAIETIGTPKSIDPHFAGADQQVDVEGDPQ